MRILYGTSAIALALGFGMAVASAPASAAGDWAGGNIVVAQAGGGGGGGTGGTGTGSGSDESGATHPMERSAANPVLEMQCDADNDGFVDTDEARACYRQRFGTISGGVGSIDEERFSESMTGMEDAPGTFAEVDADGDGQISEAEWEAWHDEGFAAATEGSEGRMSVDDYGAWEMGGRAAR